MKFKTLLYSYETNDTPKALYSKGLWFLFRDQSPFRGMKKLRNLIDLETYYPKK
jgi:hypothetical protein